MFEILPSPSWELVFIVLRGALLIGAFWVFALAFTRWRRADERDSQRLHQQLERAFAEMRSLHETVSVMSARIEALAERANVDAHLVTAATPGGSRGYDIAARLAKNGADIDDLVSTCGLTRHEAELLARLHGAKRETRAPRPPITNIEPTKPAAWTPPPTAAPAPVASPPPSGRKRGSLLSVVG